MSFHRENITWQSKDGTWNRAFYAFHDVGDRYSEDYDAEWDVEYTEDFNWVSVGHATQQRAEDSWHGANPGGMGVFVYSPNNAAECASLDERAWRFLNPAEAKRKDTRASRAAAKALFASRAVGEGTDVVVLFLASGDHDLTRTGALFARGDWLSITGAMNAVRVYNMKTGTLSPGVLSVRKQW